MGKDVIIACDFAGREQTIRFLEQFGEERPFVKSVWNCSTRRVRTSSKN